MSATYDVTDGRLAWTGQPMTTMMGCPDDLMAQDTWLTDLLVQGADATLDGDDLTLVSGDVTLQLPRETAEPAAALLGKTWTVTGIITGTSVASLPVRRRRPDARHRRRRDGPAVHGLQPRPYDGHRPTATPPSSPRPGSRGWPARHPPTTSRAVRPEGARREGRRHRRRLDRHAHQRSARPRPAGRLTRDRPLRRGRSPERFVSAGRLPAPDAVQATVDEAQALFRDDGSGELSSVYPALSAADPAPLRPGGRVGGRRGGDLRRRLRRLPPDEHRQAVRLRAGLRHRRARGGTASGRRQRDRPGLQLGVRGRARPARPDQPDGQPGRHRHHQPGARAPTSRSAGSASSTPSRAAPGGRSSSTRTPSSRPAPPTTATARWPTC